MLASDFPTRDRNWSLTVRGKPSDLVGGSVLRREDYWVTYGARLLIDAVVLSAALALGFMFRYLWIIAGMSDHIGGVGAKELAQRHLSVYADTFWILILIGLVTFWLSGLYTYARNYPIQYKALVAAQAVVFAFGLTAIAEYLVGRGESLPFDVLLIACAIAAVLIVTSRVWSAVWRHILSNEGWRRDPGACRASEMSGQEQPVELSRPGGIEALGHSEVTTDANGRYNDATSMRIDAKDTIQGDRTVAAAQLERASGPNGAAKTPPEGRHSDGRQHTVLVIGGAGYIGSALLPKLLQQGYRVRVLDLFMYGFGPIANVIDDPAVEIIRADFRQIDALVRAMQGVDHLVHLGGIVGDPACAIDEELTIDVNVAATRLVGEVAKGNGIKHFVFASTCSVYGASEHVLSETSALNPLSLYARSKMVSEQVLLKMADDTFTPTIVRFGTIYGISGRTRFDLVVNLLAAKAAFEGQITVFGGDQWRPFLHVDDAALAVAQLLGLPPGRGADVFNVGSNSENYTIAQVGDIVKGVVPGAELIVEKGDQDKRNYRVSFSKIQIMIDFEPRWKVEDGVRQIARAIRTGEVTDYHEVRYSNEKYLNEMNGNGLAPPKVHWAHDLVREPAVSAGGIVQLRDRVQR